MAKKKNKKGDVNLNNNVKIIFILEIVKKISAKNVFTYKK